MILKKKLSYYKPYFITVNNKEYMLSDIRFYNDDGIVINTGNGWFEDKNGTYKESFELPTENVYLSPSRLALRFSAALARATS